MNVQNHNDQADIRKLFPLLNSGQQTDLRQYWATLWRRKWWIILPSFLITCGSVAYALMYIRPLYVSSASIQILPSRLQRSVREVTPGVSNAVDFRELQKTILSTNNLVRLSQRLGLDKDEQALRAAKSHQLKTPWASQDELLQRLLVDRLQKTVSVTMNSGAQLFQITARHESPQLAYQMAKTLGEIFIDESKKSELRGIRGVMEFSNEQLATYQDKVKEAEENLKRFKERQATQQAMQIGLGSESIQSLRALQSTSEIAISDRERLVNQLKYTLPQNAQELHWAAVPALAKIKAQIDDKMQGFKKNVSASGLQKVYELSFDNDINILRQEYQSTLVAMLQSLTPPLDQNLHGPALQYQLAQIDLYILRTRNSMLNEIQNDFLARATMNSGDQIEARRLEDELAQNRRVYAIFLEQSRGSQIEEALQNSDADFKYRLVEPASVPVLPVGGSKRQFVSIAFLLSLVLGAVLVLGMEHFDQTIRTVEEVEEFLHLPTWGIIPKIETPFSAWHADLKATAMRSGKDKTLNSQQQTPRRQSTPKPGNSWRAQT